MIILCFRMKSHATCDVGDWIESDEPALDPTKPRSNRHFLGKQVGPRPQRCGTPFGRFVSRAQSGLPRSHRFGRPRRESGAVRHQREPGDAREPGCPRTRWGGQAID
jgi:hypothetical protein